MAGLVLVKQVNHIAEKLHMSALVRADSNGVRVLMHRSANNVVDTSVVPKMNNFAATRLN